MNVRLILMFVVALLFAGAAAWFAKEYITKRAERPPADSGTVAVVVAAVDLPFAASLNASNVRYAQWPRDALPAGVVRDKKQIEGKIVQRSFLRDEAITADRLLEHLGGSTLSAMIREGMRAISVRVDDVAGVAGFILPGNRVDILSSNPDGSSFTLLKNVNVLAIDQEVSPEKDKPAVVRALTLEVSPEEAERLDAVGRQSPLRFTLRNPSETIEPERHLGQVFAPQPAPVVKPATEAAPAAAVARPSPVTVIRWGSQAGVTTCKDEQC